MITMYIDVEVTRRKRFILIEAENGDRLWTGRRLTDAIEWLYEKDIATFQIVTEAHEYTGYITRNSIKEKPQKWPK